MHRLCSSQSIRSGGRATPARPWPTGDWLLFVDADSILNPGLLAEILQLIEEGKCVGCGSTIHMEGLPWWANWGLKLWTVTSVTFRWAAGALVVCRSDAFREVGGFNQELYAADEITLSQQLRQWGRRRGLEFVILTKCPLETSARKVLLYSAGEIVRPDSAGAAASAPVIARQEATTDLV